MRRGLVVLLLAVAVAGAAHAQEVHRAGTLSGVPRAYFRDEPPPAPRLLELARSPRIELAIAALWSLQHAPLRDTRRLRALLLETLASPDDRRAGVAAVVAERLKTDPQIAAALAGLCRGHAQPIIRANACASAGGGHEPLLASSHPYALMIALRKLPRVADADRVYPLLAHPEPLIRAWALDWLARAVDSLSAPAGVRAAAVAACRDGLRDRDPAIRTAASALGWIDLDWRAVDDVLPLLDDAAPDHLLMRYPAIGFDGAETETYESEHQTIDGRGVRAFAAAHLEARLRAYGFKPSRDDVDVAIPELKAWWAAHRAELISR